MNRGGVGPMDFWRAARTSTLTFGTLIPIAFVRFIRLSRHATPKPSLHGPSVEVKREYERSPSMVRLSKPLIDHRKAIQAGEGLQ